jgi:exodeoxyribonuclease V alpha subunit
MVDEASMVDLALMDRLVAALPASARLILLGDRDQLVSVAAGSVLADICQATDGPYSLSLAAEIAALAGESLVGQTEARPTDGGLADCVVHLRHSFRYSANSGIGKLASAIQGGRSKEALALLAAVELDDIRLLPSIAAGANPVGRGGHGGAPFAKLPKTLEAQVVGFFRSLRAAKEPTSRLALLDEFRILAAHRRGPFGVEALTQQIEAALKREGLIEGEGNLYEGRPILLTRNDYDLGLYNGDLAVVAHLNGRPMAFFPSADGPREVALGRLPRHETALAMSIHKSQGSELDEVAVILPEADSRVLSRELLYTAITRARQRVTLYGDPEAVVAAIERPVQRDSGLGSLLS